MFSTLREVIIIRKIVKAQYHLVAGGVASAALVPVLGVNSAAFFATSVLIDFDHYIDYVYRNKFTDFSVKHMFAYSDLLSEKGKERNFIGLSIMHTVEFILLVYMIAALTGLATIEAILWGLLFHMLFDLIYVCRKRIFFSRAYSVVEYVIRWNRLKRQGLHPELPYELAIQHVLSGSKPPGNTQEE